MNMVRFLLGTVVFIALVLKVNATGGSQDGKKRGKKGVKTRFGDDENGEIRKFRVSFFL